MLAMAVMLKHDLRADEPPFHLGGRAIGDLPPLTDEELSSPQQQALLHALGGNPHGQRAADFCRAGHPALVRRHAIPSNNCRYGGYWIGGGKPVLGDRPTFDEGTFGWDYLGILFNKRIALNWSHGRHYQGGAGAYQTDGPKLRRE